jgi:hypothetical protein
MARYLPPGLPPPPAAVDRTAAVTVPWGMMLNDTEGDCTIAAMGHNIMAWTANGKGLFVPSDADIQKAYENVGQFDPSQTQPDGSNPTDNGCNADDVLKYCRDTGISGRKIGAWVRVFPDRRDEVMQSINLFGAWYIGLSLPDAFQDLTSWEIPSGQSLTGAWEPNPNNGHMVMGSKYDDSGAPVITWGQPMFMSWDFAAAYADECYCILSPDQIRSDGTCPAGFDLPTLQKDLQIVSVTKSPA